MPMSNYAEAATLNVWLRATALTTPATVYMALYTTDPTDADTGTEVSGNGYTRQTIAFNAVTVGDPSTVTNNGAVEFVASGGSFGTVTHVGIRDAATVGNLIYHFALDTARTILDGDTFSFADATSISVGQS